MLIENQFIKIKWNNSNRKHLENLGYIYNKNGNEISIKVEHLSRASHIKVKVKCDYCELIYEKQFKYINPNIKDACKNCNFKKGQETNLKKYGNICSLHGKDIKEKVEKTNLEKYGVKHNFSNGRLRDKMKQSNLEKYGNTCTLHGKEINIKTRKTWLQKYGVGHCLQSKKIRDKIRETNQEKYGNTCAINSEFIKEQIKKNNLEKYGVEYNWQREDIKEQIKRTNLIRYGVEYVSQNKEIKEKQVIGYIKSISQSNKGLCSKYQKRLHDLLGGELNYPFKRCLLDIAFLDELIYLEYNGGGHYIYDTVENKKQKDKNRQYYLKKQGWKSITIININEQYFDNLLIIQLVNQAKDILLNTKYSWVEIDIDNKIFKYKKEIININGEYIKIKF